jgi:hypothetical protein
MAAFGVALCVNVCIILYVSLWLQESYFPQDQTRTGPLVKIHSHINNVLSVLFQPRPDNQRMYLLVVLFVALPLALMSKFKKQINNAFVLQR